MLNLILLFSLPLVRGLESLKVDTTSGIVQGVIDTISPNVALFLGIPYAQQPIGSRRWLPSRPVVKKKSIDATRFGPACPQFEGNQNTTWLSDAPEFKIVPRDFMGEDCLSVNLWVPWKERKVLGDSARLLPVVAWIHGGSFQTGGASIPYQNPSRWVQRSRRHIVVGINYRLSIFGTPNAAGLKSDEQNLGLLDQRMAVEWIRDNIVNFGGDPNRITLWGHSAGAVSVDSYNFAYPHDPIVSALIMSSGTSQSNIPYVPGPSNFTIVAKGLGCEKESAAAEIACLRKVPFRSIIAFLKARFDSKPSSLRDSFTPMIDNRTVFANYTQRALAGNFSRLPAIIGTTVDEFGVFLPYNRTYGPNRTVADKGTMEVFLCPSVLTTHERHVRGAQTFRYLYGGNFSNIAPQWWQGAYHQADMPIVFGAHDIARNKSTPFEVAVSEKMQDYWLAFVEDPVKGLPRLGWKSYSPGPGGKSVLIGWKGRVVQPIADSELEAPCNGRVPNGKPNPPTTRKDEL